MIDFKIGDLNDKSILEKTTDIDTSMYLMVFNKEGIELELDQTFNVYLDCSDNTECIMTFYNGEHLDEIGIIINKTKGVFYTVVENRDHFKSKIKQEED